MFRFIKLNMMVVLFSHVKKLKLFSVSISSEKRTAFVLMLQTLTISWLVGQMRLFSSTF